MNSRVGIRWAALVAVLALAGCGKDPKPVAKGQVDTPPTEPAAPVLPPPVTPPTQPADPMPPVEPPPMPPPTGFPTPRPMNPPVFVPPTSPAFTPPESLPGTQLPGTPTFPPKPTDPKPPTFPPMPPAGPTPEPPKPTDPATPPGTPKPTTPAKIEYPTEVGGKTLDEWLQELRYTGGGPIQRDDQIREIAVKSIPAFGPEARKPSVKPLIEAIRLDPDPGVQVAAITVVSNMGFDLRDEVRPVISVLQSKLNLAGSGNMVKMYCVKSLASFGPDAAVAIPSFKNSCLDPSWETRREIAIALSMVGTTPMDSSGKPLKDTGPDKRAIEILMDYQLQDRSVVVRTEAVKSLLALGPPYSKDPQDFIKQTEKARKTIAEVVKFESGKGGRTNARGATPDRGMYVWALLLQLMYDDRTIPDNIKELAKLVKEPDGPNADFVRLYALQALGAAGPLSAPAVPTVTEALLYKHEPMLVLTAMNALALIGNEARDAVPQLEKLAGEPPLPPPPDAPEGTPPDDTLQVMARQTIEVITGKRQMEDYGKVDPKPMEKK